MNANLKIKKNTIDEIVSKIEKAKSMVIVRYHGLNVNNLMNLRTTLREKEVEFKVYKNTLIQLALKKLKIEGLDNNLTGPNGLVFSNLDSINGPKLLLNFAKKAKALTMEAAIFEGDILNKEELMEIANLPSKEGLISMFASMLLSTLIKFVLLIKALIEKKEAAEQN